MAPFSSLNSVQQFLASALEWHENQESVVLPLPLHLPSSLPLPSCPLLLPFPYPMSSFRLLSLLLSPIIQDSPLLVHGSQFLVHRLFRSSLVTRQVSATTTRVSKLFTIILRANHICTSHLNRDDNHTSSDLNLVIIISSRQHNRIGTFVLSAMNASDVRSVHSSLTHLLR